MIRCRALRQNVVSASTTGRPASGDRLRSGTLPSSATPVGSRSRRPVRSTRRALGDEDRDYSGLVVAVVRKDGRTREAQREDNSGNDGERAGRNDQEDSDHGEDVPKPLRAAGDENHCANNREEADDRRTPLEARLDRQTMGRPRATLMRRALTEPHQQRSDSAGG